MEIIGERDHIIDGKIETHVNECISELMRDSSNQAALCESHANSIEGLNVRVNDVGSDFESKMTMMLDVIESCDERVQAVQNRNADFDEQLSIKLDDKQTEIEQRIHDLDERLESEIASLQEVVGDFRGKLDEVEVQELTYGRRLGSAHGGDSGLCRPIYNTLQQRKELASQDGKLGCNTNVPSILESHANINRNKMHTPQRLSNADRRTARPLEDEPPVIDIVVMKTSRPSNQTGDSSPSSIVHLLGLGSSSSIDSSMCTEENDDRNTSHTPIDSQGSSSGDDANETQEEIILERNRLLTNVARTLSNVAKKRDDSSLHELAAEMRAGKLSTSTNDPSEGSFGCQLQRLEKADSSMTSSGTEQVRGSIIDSLDSAVQSINTAEALSLCGVHLDENDDEASLRHVNKSETAESIVGSIETADDIASCGIQATSDEHEEGNDSPEVGYGNGADGSSTENSASQLQHKSSSQLLRPSADPRSPIESLTPIESSPGDSTLTLDEKLDENKSTSNESSSSSMQELESLARHLSGMEEDNFDDNGTSSTGNSNVTDSKNNFSTETDGHNDIFNEQENQSHGGTTSSSIQEEVSLPGSITSFDEIECIDEMQPSKSSSHVNPTRLSNPEPYQGWDVLLTELQESGLILRDRESTTSHETGSENDVSVSSYGSGSFESEGTEIT